MKHKWFLSLLLLGIASALLGIISAAALAGYTLDWWTVDGGGATFSTGGSYSLGGTIGQPDVGTSTGGPYTLDSGFWGGSVDIIPLPVVLNVSKSGTGSGTVTSTPAGIDCGSDCSETYDYNTSVTLKAAAASGSTFTGWSGSGCSGTGTCMVTMDAAKSVTADFSLNAYQIYLPLVIK
jgi:Divergent InlB B-repeat domain